MTRENNIAEFKEKRLYFGPQYSVGASEPETLPIENGRIYLFVNETDMVRLLTVESQTDIYKGSFSEGISGVLYNPMYLYYDREVFEQLIQEKDISQLCRRYRIVLLVGEEQLESFFGKEGTVFPQSIAENGTRITEKISALHENKTKRLIKQHEELIAYYESNQDSIRQRIHEKRGKILIPRYLLEPQRFKKFYEIVKREFEQQGFQVVINEQQESVYYFSEIELLHSEKPDAVFVINKFRIGDSFSGECFQAMDCPGLYYINWLQDFCPTAFSATYASKLLERDIIFSYFETDFLQRFGYGKEHIIEGGLHLTDPELFTARTLTREEKERYECDICFAGRTMTTKDMVDFAMEQLQGYFTQDEIVIVLEKMVDIIQGIYDVETGKYNICWQMLFDIREQLQSQFGCSDDNASRIFRVLALIRYSVFRRLIMQQLAELKKYKIYYYGEKDIEIPGVEYRGYVQQEEEMSKAFQASGVVLQINADATFNQRVTETLFSGGTILAYKMDPKEDMARCSGYVEEGEGIIYFSDKEELINNIEYLLEDEGFREHLSITGRNKARKSLSSETIMGAMIQRLVKYTSPSTD